VVSELRIRSANASDLEVARSWLADAGLPTEDLTPDHMQSFLVALVDDKPVGMIGLEQLGEAGLLRSLVVDTNLRSGGIGRRLVAALEAKAAACGVARLWLLTIDADRYFARLGFEAVARSEAPNAIQRTAEFADLCPGDAVLMRKKL